MRRVKAKTSASSAESGILRGWPAIAKFLSQPVSVAQRWGKTGMPVKRQGRFVTAVPDELNRWLGREAGGEPLHVAVAESDLAAELKRGLAYIRKQRTSAKTSQKMIYKADPAKLASTDKP